MKIKNIVLTESIRTSGQAKQGTPLIWIKAQQVYFVSESATTMTDFWLEMIDAEKASLKSDI